MNGTDPKKKKTFKKGERVKLDGVDITKLKPGVYKTGESIALPTKKKKKYTGKASNPGATMKVIKSSGKKKKSKAKTNYGSTGSKKGKATPKRKKKYGA